MITCEAYHAQQRRKRIIAEAKEENAKDRELQSLRECHARQALETEKRDKQLIKKLSRKCENPTYEIQSRAAIIREAVKRKRRAEQE